MKSKSKLDMNKIAKTLGAERRGKVSAKSGHFGAMQLVAEAQSRFRAPAGGGRATDPHWTERRLVPLTPETLARLSKLARSLGKELGVALTPLQLAALLLEHAAGKADEDAARLLAREHVSHRKSA
jgi:hypothetical protein